MERFESCISGMWPNPQGAWVLYKDADKRIAFLEEQLRRIHRVGHNDDCLFCGFKDRQVMESNVIEGTAAMSAEEVAEQNEADRIEAEMRLLARTRKTSSR